MVDLRVAPAPASTAVRTRFRRQGRRDTEPELAVRRRLHARGVRYRVDVRPCRETRARGDLVWRGRRIVVFVDGCFWHACPVHGRPPTRNEWYWSPKLQRNVERDRRADSALTAAGWSVVRVWEHETIEAALEAVLRAVDMPGRVRAPTDNFGLMPPPSSIS